MQPIGAHTKYSTLLFYIYYKCFDLSCCFCTHIYLVIVKDISHKLFPLSQILFSFLALSLVYQ